MPLVCSGGRILVRVVAELPEEEKEEEEDEPGQKNMMEQTPQ